MAVVLNLFLVWIYWTYAPVVFADNNNTIATATRCDEDCNTDCYPIKWEELHSRNSILIKKAGEDT